MNISILKKSSGQAFIELTILLPLVCSCFFLSLFMFQVYTQQLWMDHQLYQALICIAKGKQKFNCQNKMQKNIKSFLHIGKLKNINLSKKNEEINGIFTWKTPLWNIKFQKKFNLKTESLL